MTTESHATSSDGYSQTKSVTDWINALKNEADQGAAQQIWDRYVTALIRVARKRLGHTSRRVGDEEDIVAIAFRQFFEKVDQGGFSRLDDRDDLWQLLVMLTERRAIDQMRRTIPSANQPKTFGESAFVQGDSGEHLPGLDALEAEGPTPQSVLETLEEAELRLRSLNNAKLEAIAIAKLNGKTNHQIADQLDMGLRSVERKLALIRRTWQSD